MPPDYYFIKNDLIQNLLRSSKRWLNFWIKFSKCSWSWIDWKHTKGSEIQFEYGSSLSPPSCNTLTHFLPLVKAIKSQPWLFATLMYIQNSLTILIFKSSQSLSQNTNTGKHRKTYSASSQTACISGTSQIITESTLINFFHVALPFSWKKIIRQNTRIAVLLRKLLCVTFYGISETIK